MRALTLLAIDDDDTVLQSLRLVLPKEWNLVTSNSPKNIPDVICHAAFVDCHLTGDLSRAEGLDVMGDLHSRHPHLEIVAISGDLDRALMEKCLRKGASRFLSKPLNLDEVKITLEKIEALIQLQNTMQRHPDQKYFWIGQGPASQNIRRQIAFLRGENGPILIEGESGAGKEVAAHLMHQQEELRPFIAVNVASIPDNLFESEIFGHARGAFTGAERNKMGLAEAAHNGDLFLDEIEALSSAHQAKLLRFLETGEIRRVGANEMINVKVRVIAATNRSLEEMVRKGEFREDLYWRLSGKKIKLSPLRERREDIEELANWFMSQEKNFRKELSPEAVQDFIEYHWPGNVRELKRVCEQLALTSPLPIIRAEDVRRLLRPTVENLDQQKIDYTNGLTAIVESFEARVISSCLKQYTDVDEAARVLKVSRSNLYKKIKDLNIEWGQS